MIRPLGWRSAPTRSLESERRAFGDRVRQAGYDAAVHFAETAGLTGWRDYHTRWGRRRASCIECREEIADEDLPLEDGRVGIGACDCTREAQEQARLEYERKHSVKAARAAWIYADIPPRYRDVAFETTEEREGIRDALAICRKYAEAFAPDQTTGGLVLTGGWGAGKTHLAVATCRRVFERTWTAPEFTTAGKLVSRLKASGFDDEILERVREAPLLVLDDLGQTRATDFGRDTIYQLVDHRYENQRPTLITSNAGSKQLAEIYGGALVSRLHEMARGVQIDAGDYRKRLGRGSV